jgi:radical SAM protein with 4Fe4S-binding SPASM domain
MELHSYSEFSLKIHQEVNPKRIPVNGTIEMTNRCPLDCQHCYNNLPMGDADARRRELTTEEHKRLIDEVVDMGCLWMLYSGGEIFARRDFLEIYRYAKEQGLLVTLFTNGVLITESIADFLVEWRPFEIEITLYGATAETYEALTGVPGSYAKCMRGIELLLERGLPLSLKTVAVSINVHELSAMRELAESLGVEFKFDPMISPRIDCSSSPLSVRLRPEEIVALDLEDPKRVSEWRRMADDFAPPVYAEGDEKPQVYDCGGGVNSFAVDPYGDVTICVLSHFDRYNLRDGSFSEGWEYLSNIRRKTMTRPTKCTNCSLRSMCGMCPATAELENGDPEEPVDFLCQVAHLRAEAFDIDVRPHGDCEYCGEKRGEIERMMAAARQGIDYAAVMAAIPPPAPSAAGCAGGCSGCAIR